MTVSDADRSVAFYEEVFDFEKVSDVEVDSAGHSRLVGVFGARMRVVRMRLEDVTQESSTQLADRPVIDGLPQTSPADEFNQLVGNVHPLDWVNPQPSGRYNLVVIGAGTTGRGGRFQRGDVCRHATGD